MATKQISELGENPTTTLDIKKWNLDNLNNYTIKLWMETPNTVEIDKTTKELPNLASAIEPTTCTEKKMEFLNKFQLYLTRKTYNQLTTSKFSQMLTNCNILGAIRMSLTRTAFSQKFLVIEHFRELRKSFPDKGFNEDLDYVINLAEKHAGYFS